MPRNPDAPRRRPNAPTTRRTIRHVVLCTEQEEWELQAKATDAKVTVPKLLMDAALGMPSRSRDAFYTQLHGIRRQLTGSTGNLNALAAALHTGHAVQPGEVLTLLATFQRQTAELDELMAALR